MWKIIRLVSKLIKRDIRLTSGVNHLFVNNAYAELLSKELGLAAVKRIKLTVYCDNINEFGCFCFLLTEY